jgi:Cu/Ag efflux pump CusA
MIRWVVGSSLKFPLMAVAVAAAVLAVGITQLREMSVDVLPEFAPPTVEIQTEALGLSASEVEQLITVPTEQDLLVGVAFLKDIRSESVAGLSRILLVFEPGTDLFRARQVVAERLTQAHALPHVSKPPQMLQPLSSTNRIMMIGLSSKTVSPIEMSVLTRWTIAPRLMGVPGVANVSIWGQRDRQLQVQVDPKRLRDRDVSLQQVVETAGNALWVSPLTYIEASTPGTGGFIDTPNQRLGVQHLLPITRPEHLAQVRLEDERGRNLRLGDVASIVEDHQPLIGDAVVGDGGGLLFVIEKFPEANALDVTKRVEAAIASMQPGLSGLEFDTTVYRPASYIEKSIDNFTHALIIGAALLIAILASFFVRWRLVVVASVAIVLSIVAGVLVLFAFGETMNAMVMAGLVAALLLVVHDAVGDVDAVALRLRRAAEEGRDSSTARVILDATLELRSAALFAGLVVALAVVPLFFLEGVAGAFFPSIAVAFLAALAASMAVALTITPALCLLLLSNGHGARAASPLARWLRRGYEGMLSSVVDRPRGVYLAAGAVVLAAAVTVPFLRSSPLPTFKETQLLIRWDAPPGTSLPEMNRITSRATRELRAIDGVENVGAHVGRAVMADQVVGVNSGEIWVSIDPSANYGATVASIEEVAAGYPGFSRDVRPFSNERVSEVLSGLEDDMVVRIYGENLSVLDRKAGDVKQALAGVEGVVDPRVHYHAVEPTLEIEPSLAATRRFGIKPGDVRRAAATMLSGIAVGSLFEKQKVFDVVVWGTPETRASLTDVRDLLIDTPSGGRVRLGDVAAVRIAPNPATIKRDRVSRYIDVSASVSGRDLDTAVQDAKNALKTVDFPLEFHAEVLSDQTSVTRMVAIVLAVTIAIFLLFQAAFGSWRLAAVTCCTLPLAPAGGLFAAWADGGALSFGSYIGLLAVFGLAARNSILLVNRCRQLEAVEEQTVGPELVVQAAAERFTAVMAATAATAALLLPVLIAGPIFGFEVVYPLAVVVFGGLISSLLLTLFVSPAVNVRFGWGAAPEHAAPVTATPQVAS